MAAQALGAPRAKLVWQGLELRRRWAEPGTIRKELAESIEVNTVHASDSDENAAIEIAYFFKPEEIVG